MVATAKDCVRQGGGVGGRHVCDDECDTPSCNFDGGDCYTFDRQRPMATSAVRCAWGCPDSWRGDGECDAGCCVTACNFDSGDCTASLSKTCLRTPSCRRWHAVLRGRHLWRMQVQGRGHEAGCQPRRATQHTAQNKHCPPHPSALVVALDRSCAVGCTLASTASTPFRTASSASAY